MKISMLQMITIVCILSAGFMTVAPFVQTAESHGDAHQYDATVDIVLLTQCDNCGSWTVSIIGQMIMTFEHLDGQQHITSGSLYLYGTTSRCSVCDSQFYT